MNVTKFSFIILICLFVKTGETANIGIFFGNFDPIHRIHDKIIQQSIAQLNLDRLYVVPYYETDKLDGENYLVRTQLLRRAITEIPRMELFGSRRVAEVGRKTNLLNKSVEFFEQLVIDEIRYSEGWDQEFFLIVGTDEFLRIVSAQKFPKSGDPMNLVVIKRRGFDQTVPRYLVPLLGTRLFMLDFAAPKISSTQLRDELAHGCLSNAHFLHDSVLESIVKRGFYGYEAMVE